MSFSPIIIRCNGCNCSCIEIRREITLLCEVENGVATYDSTSAWCNQCSSICRVEVIPTLEELQIEYERRLGQIPVTNPNHRWSLKRVKEYKDNIAWRKSRIAPPRCLTCGSTDITYVDYEKVNGIFVSKTFHHKCGGSLVIDPAEGQNYSISGFDEDIWMDIDGYRLPETVHADLPDE